ncbi:hypothetical protein [Endozoicomonas sp. GU-1]|uniref:hypothetical protein n=1 Tax=Endozoicomonas sp. GU-1 TaxID=3009078 RepID=UPI0022B5CCCD|nr:hypothetical protein [Endozoicomonas sp. GU-1]WBA86537.1 hypothetical protein O3276_00300 [Endozoicomonas sp. GU-1]
MAWVLMIVGVVLALLALIGISNRKAAKEAGLETKKAVGMIFFGLVLALFGYGLKVDSFEGPGLQAVLATIPEGDAHSWETGQFNDGVAVVINGSAGYWVKDGTAYAVNGVAKMLSSDIDYAPQGVSWLNIEEAVQ